MYSILCEFNVKVYRRSDQLNVLMRSHEYKKAIIHIQIRARVTIKPLTYKRISTWRCRGLTASLTFKFPEWSAMTL